MNMLCLLTANVTEIDKMLLILHAVSHFSIYNITNIV